MRTRRVGRSPRLQDHEIAHDEVPLGIASEGLRGRIEGRDEAPE